MEKKITIDIPITKTHTIPKYFRTCTLIICNHFRLHTQCSNATEKLKLNNCLLVKKTPTFLTSRLYLWS